MKSFNPDEIPSYAILSHKWGRDEVLYTDIINKTSRSREAYDKVKSACEKAIEYGFDYVWIDTCCIDKSSSAELSEAINSMFGWYSQSQVCFAFLSDYMNSPEEQGEAGDKAFSESRWFTRGWTLQELLAPSRIIFFGAGWVEIGTKTDLRAELASFTRISEDILIGRRPLETASIANRMGWAAHRVTTRPEDIAYCLMGLFDVNMPLLYGEGSKAFLRLQEEIMKHTTDHTLFAWMDANAPDSKECGLLAPSPACFAKTHTVVPYEDFMDRAPHSVTNKGLSIELRIQQRNSQGLYVATLNCPPPDFQEGQILCIYLQKTSSNTNRFARVRTSRLDRVRTSKGGIDESGTLEQIYVQETAAVSLNRADLVFPYHFLVFTRGPPAAVYSVAEIITYPEGEKTRPLPNDRGVGWAERTAVVRRGPGKVTIAVLFVRRADRKRLLVTIGSFDALRLAFDAVELTDAPGPFKPGAGCMPPASWVRDNFKPKRLGEAFDLPNHRVRVDATTQFHKNAKTYKVSLDVTPTSGGNAEDSKSSSSTSKLQRWLG